MKINNKGMTLIELILSFVILSIIVLGMLEIVLNVRKKAADEYFARDMLVYKNTIVKLIEDKLLKNDIANVTCDNLYCQINFVDGNSSELKLDTVNKYISFDGKRYDIPSGDHIDFGNSSMMVSSMGDKKALLSIIISYKEKGTNVPDYGFKIVQPLDINNNILVNGNFLAYKTVAVPSSSPVINWDTTLNPSTAVLPTGWSNGYNSGVSSPTSGYHAYFDVTKFSYPVMNFTNKNSIVSQTNRWLGILQYISGDLTPNTVYTISMDIKSDTIGAGIRTGLYYRLLGSDVYAFNSGTYDFITVSDEVNKWVRKSYTFTTNENFDTDYVEKIYIYGHCGLEGISYVKNVKLERGNIGTTFVN